MKRLSIKTKIGVGVFLMGMIICVVSCFVGYYSYKTDMEKYYNDQAYEIATLASTVVTPAQITNYLETMQTDDQHAEITASLQEIRASLNANYIYIARQEGDVLTYIFDSGNPYDGYDTFTLGDTSNINPEFLEDSTQILETGERSDNYFYSESLFGYNTSAILPVIGENGAVIAIIGVELTMQGLQTMLVDYMKVVFIVTPFAILLLLILFLKFVSKSVIKPIEKIKTASEEFTKTKTPQLDDLIKIKTGDEIEVLAKSTYDMQKAIINHVEEIKKVTTEKERISAELDVARKIQEYMLPIPTTHPNKEYISLHAIMKPAKEVGGDFYDFFQIDDDHIGIVIADVSGKGVPASLFMVIAKTMLKNASQSGISPAEVFEKVNNQLSENNGGEMFVTCLLGILNVKTGELECVNAGHEYPAIKRGNGEFELYRDNHGFVLAGMEDMTYESYTLKLESGDTLFLYTDGVAEATNVENELYGTQRMLEKLSQHANLSTREICDEMLNDIKSFTGKAQQFDDITMLCLKYIAKDVQNAQKNFDIQTSKVSDIVDFCEEVMENSDVESTVQIKVAIALDELCMNIFSYSEATTCNVLVHALDNKVLITLKDNGMPYNPLSNPDPDTTLSASEREIGGLGVYIVKNISSEVTYNYANQQNILNITIENQHKE